MMLAIPQSHTSRGEFDFQSFPSSYLEKICKNENENPRNGFLTPRYTSGDMAGLAIGMVFGGLLLAGVHLIRLFPTIPLKSVHWSVSNTLLLR